MAGMRATLLVVAGLATLATVAPFAVADELPKCTGSPFEEGLVCDAGSAELAVRDVEGGSPHVPESDLYDGSRSLAVCAAADAPIEEPVAASRGAPAHGGPDPLAPRVCVKGAYVYFYGCQDAWKLLQELQRVIPVVYGEEFDAPSLVVLV